MKKTNFQITSGGRKLCPLRPQTLCIRSHLVSWTKSGRKHWDLYRYLLNPYVLADATKLVLSNRGSYGIDEVTCAEVRALGWEFISGLVAKLKSKTYRPSAVRRVYIPKRDGRRRPLGIPTVEDRVVQRALVLLMEPIYEQSFLPCSYGFRPQRSGVECAYAIVSKVYRHRFVVDADIEDFFGSVHHDKLLGMIKEKIVDPRILDLLKQIMCSGFVEGKSGVVTAVRQGTPQGGPLSPLLANVYLHYGLDQRFAEEFGGEGNWELFRYADDLVVTCASESDLRVVVTVMREWLKKVGLKFHPTKSRAVDMRGLSGPHKSRFDFLGFKFHLRTFKDSRRTWIARQPSERARKQLRTNLREKLIANLSHETAQLRVRQIWQGWCGYFRYGNSNRVFYREVNTVKRSVYKYLRRKYRRTRRPRPWSELIPIAKEIFKGIRPMSVITGPPNQRDVNLVS